MCKGYAQEVAPPSKKYEIELMIARDNGLKEAILTLPHNFHNLDAFELVEYRYSTAPHRIELKLKDASNKQYDVKAKFDEAIMVPAPRLTISRGAVIRAEDLLMVKFPKSRSTHNIITDQTILIGANAKRALQARKIINKYDIAKASVVQKGQMVKMVYTKGSVTIETKGIAMAEAGIDDYLSVRNPDSNKIVVGKVINNDTIMVEAR